MAAILLNAVVLGDDSAFSGALAGADGKRNAPSRGGDAGCKSEGRARNGDKLVVLDSARTTPSETARKSVSVMKRVSGQSSLRNRNEARNDHVGVGNELPDQPATSHKSQAGVDDKYGMKLPHARRPATSRHGEGGLTSKNEKESAEALDRKREFENMISGIIAEVADSAGGGSSSRSGYCGNDYDYYGYGCPGYDYQPVAGVESGVRRSEHNASTSEQVPRSGPKNDGKNNQPVEPSSSVTSGAAGSDQSPVNENKDGGNTNDKAQKDVQEKEEDGKEKGEIQLDKQKSDENSDERETNNSREDAENEEAPSSGNSAFLSGSYSSVLLVAVACLCARAC
ncbi:hypothetical protein, conserved in T. vivax, (fragment) [Trypanosoma vivax Y486]|uniref:Uncharacterized protein n=1 Tax=Trypanosoma vivax (strain Y486) TaxID=1055687 RepID=F9WRN4_TRYVY